MSVTLRKRTLPSSRTQLYLDIYLSGQRSVESLGLFLDGDKLQRKETMKLAEAVRAQRELETQAERHGVQTHNYRKGDFLEYFDKLTLQKTAENTRRIWGMTKKHLLSFAGDKKVPFASINKEWVKDFRAYLLSKTSRNTAYIYYARFKAALAEALSDGRFQVNPANGVTIIRQKSLPVYLTLEEVQRLATARCRNEHVRNAFLFSCFTGLRISDVRALEWSQICEGFILFRQKKTQDPERMPLSHQAQELLDRQKLLPDSKRVHRPRPEHAVFHLPPVSTVDIDLKLWAEKAGLNKRISFHTSRHTFATLALNIGVDIYTVSKLLGHRSLSATQIYTKVIDKTKKEAVEMLPHITLPSAGDNRS